MLTIRQEQMQTFEEQALLRFEDEMVRHSQVFTPPLCKVLGEDQLRVALRRAMKRAGTHGFTLRGPIRTFIELTFLFGSNFDTDPQYPWAAEILGRDIAEMERAERLVARVTDFQEKTVGPDGVYSRRAFEELLIITHQPSAPPADDLTGFLRQELKRVYPQKVGFIGDRAVDILIRQGMAAAAEHDFVAGRGRMLMVVLMFAFGHGCAVDPLYPWIERTLADEKIVDAAARAERLEKKAGTWLENVLTNLQNEASPS